MKLAQLKVLREGTVVQPSACKGLESCKTCPLYKKNDGRCGGCTQSKQATMNPKYLECYQECHECTGFDAEVTAICCRSPLRDLHMTALTKGSNWNKPEWRLRKRPILEFQQKAVFYISAGSLNALTVDDEYLVPEETEVVAVSLARVFTGKKFASYDMRDYLKIAKSTKLILLTMNRDDVLEKAWDREIYDFEEYERIGFDHWMPIAFSSYYEEPAMQQYYSFLRTMWTAEQSQAWFSNAGYLRNGLQLNDLLLRSDRAMPQWTFNGQFLYDEEALQRFLISVKRMNSLVSGDHPFWIVGPSKPKFMHNVRRMVEATRPLYFVSANPHHYSTQGKEMGIAGKAQKSTLPKPELLQRNIDAVQRMVKAYG